MSNAKEKRDELQKWSKRQTTRQATRQATKMMTEAYNKRNDHISDGKLERWAAKKLKRKTQMRDGEQEARARPQATRDKETKQDAATTNQQGAIKADDRGKRDVRYRAKAMNERTNEAKEMS